MTGESRYDHVVIGAGPAGSTIAALLAEEGLSVLVLEAARFPRFAVGEIVAPTALWRVWHRLGIGQEQLDEHFIRKFAGAWQSPDGTVFRFEQDVHPDDHRCRSFVYTFDRATYDHLLMKNAVKRGAVVLEEARVEHLLRDDEGRVIGLSYSHEGSSHEVRCTLVVDASGRANVLGRLLDLRKEMVELKSFALFAHYEDVTRDEGDAEGDVRLIFSEDEWFWWAPLKAPRASIGLVANRERFYDEYLADPEAFFERRISGCAFIQERLGGARRITGFRQGDRAAFADYHFTTSQMVGDGWATVGDASGFVDPIFSAGLYVAQVSAMWLADTLVEGHAKGDLSSKHLSTYERRYDTELRQVMTHISNYATEYFDPKFVNFYLRLANRHEKIRRLYIDTFIAYDPDAIREYGRLIERYFAGLRVLSASE